MLSGDSSYLIISLGTLSVIKKCVHSITCKQFKISSWNFIWISINIRQRAKHKNHNSCIYTFWVISLGISLVNINICWMHNTIWHQKGGGGGIYVFFVDKQSLVWTSNLDTSKEVRVSWRFVPGEGQNWFSRSQLYWPSCSLEQNWIVLFILLESHLDNIPKKFDWNWPSAVGGGY